MGYYKVRVNVKDQNGNPAVGVRVSTSAVGYMNQYTDSSGNVYFRDVVSGTRFTYTASPPQGYTCDDCVHAHTLSDRDIWTQLKMIKAAAPTAKLTVNCKTSSGAPIPNAAITIDGAHQGYTNQSGAFTKELVTGNTYTVKAVRSGYVTTSKTVSMSWAKTLNITMVEADAFVCAEGATSGYHSCPDGSHYYDKKCVGNRWVVTGDKCPEVTPEAGERAEITNVQYPAEAGKGDEIDVKVYAKNMGTERCELRAYLVDVVSGKTIDAEPDTPNYEPVAVGQTGSILLTTNWHIGAMPANDWKLQVVLMEVNPGVNKKHDSRTFTVKYVPPVVVVDDLATGERAEITNVQYPAEAGEGDEITVDVTFKNVGTEKCELRARLLDVTRYDTVIDTEPDIMFEDPAPGTSGTITLTTNWHDGAMPKTDWKLRVELLEINKITNAVQKVQDTRNITIKNVVADDGGDWWDAIIDPFLPGEEDDADDVVTDSQLTIDVPSFTIAGDVDVSGTAPPGQNVQIVVSEAKYGIDVFAADDVIKTVASDSGGKYNTTVLLEEFGSIGVYARVKKAGWLGIDMLARDMVSKTSTVWVLTYPILAMLGLMMLMVYDKASGGVIRKMLKRGKKK